MSYTLINDSLYGFVQITDPLIKSVIDHPYFQRLRRLKQMGMADLVFPGANHSRLQHSIGSLYLAQKAIKTFERKKIALTQGEQQGLQLAALLHDIGHGPFSHSSEQLFIENTKHETITLKIVERLNLEFEGKLDIAMAILKGDHPKKFLIQLVEGQIDLDRLDYLNRDSYFTGVSRVNFDVDRIIEMLDVKENTLVYDFKSLHTLEKFLFDRRFMTLQVYGHKNNLLADLLLKKIWERFKQVKVDSKFPLPNISFWLGLINKNDGSEISQQEVDAFLALDDSDVIQLLKYGKNHGDKTLQFLCNSLLNRNFPRIQISCSKSFDSKVNKLIRQLPSWQQNPKISEYFVFAGSAKSLTYSSKKDSVMVKLKNDDPKPLHELAEFLISPYFSEEHHVYYLCYPK